MNSKDISRSAGGIGLATLGSRILGFARDVLIAKYFGTGMEAQAFFAAFRIPNLMRRLFGEGALSAGFIPIFTEEMQKKGKDSAWALALSVMSLLSGVLVVCVGLGILFAPVITGLMVPGFKATPSQFELTTSLLRVMFPYTLLICLSALIMGILNSLKHFAAPAAAPMLFNAALISYLVFFADKAATPVWGLGVAVLIGGAAQFCLQMAVVIRKGLPLKKKIKLMHPRVKKIVFLMLPAAGGLAVYQLNVLVDSICASYEAVVGRGAIAALWYADRLMQFPLALFGIATATAIFPVLSAAASSKDTGKFVSTLEFGLKRVFFLMLPSSAGLVALREPIISVLFERNEFGAYSTAITSSVLMYYSLGLFAYAGVHILSRGFYARHDTRTPVKIAILAMALNAGLNLILMHPLRAGGIALATSAAATVNFLLLFRRMAKADPGIDAAGIGRSFLRVLAVSVMMAVLLVFLWGVMPEAGTEAVKLLQLAFALSAGAAIFILSAAVFGFEEWEAVKLSFKRKTSDEKN